MDTSGPGAVGGREREGRNQTMEKEEKRFGGRMKKERESFERRMKVRTEKEKERERTNLRTCQTQHRHKSCFFVPLELF